jgi:hypothetical protein
MCSPFLPTRQGCDGADDQSNKLAANVIPPYSSLDPKLIDSDETHFVFPLEQPYDINHLTVFLTGAGTSPILSHAEGSSISRRIWCIGTFRLAFQGIYTFRGVSLPPSHTSE